MNENKIVSICSELRMGCGLCVFWEQFNMFEKDVVRW